MKDLMVLCFLAGALWDGTTTALGIATIIDATDPLGYALCAVGGLVILGFGIGTKTIWSEKEFVYLVLKIMWFLAIIFDFYTSYLGNAEYIVLKKSINGASSSINQTVDARQFLVLIVLTILVTSSPIIISYLWKE